MLQLCGYIPLAYLAFLFCREFYGPGGPYALFAGRDASTALAKMSFEEADILNSGTTGLSKYEIGVLDDWENKFTFKYENVGKVVVADVSESSLKE